MVYLYGCSIDNSETVRFSSSAKWVFELLCVTEPYGREGRARGRGVRMVFHSGLTECPKLKPQVVHRTKNLISTQPVLCCQSYLSSLGNWLSNFSREFVL